MTQHTSLVIGANGGIGRALVDHLKPRADTESLLAVAREHPGRDDQDGTLQRIQSDYSEENIKRICQSLAENDSSFSEIYICNGMLHGHGVQPEKRLESFDSAQFLSVLHANTLTPLLWLKHLMPVLRQSDHTRVAVLSARVGSISDNRLGGWYSYRSTKAALNMLLKTAAIEFSRRLPQVKLMAFHPGTTDTPLSKPFQANVRPERLFTPEFVAEQLVSLLRSREMDGALEYLDWAGKPIPW